jgi:hypothetical protein
MSAVGSFDGAWLALREPADTAARSSELAGLVAGALRARGLIRAVDLAGGTGANARFLIPRLPRPQRWLLADADPVLLTEATRAMGPAFGSGACHLDTRQLNLANTDSLSVIEDRDLVTASALLDLVSAEWLDTLLPRCRETGAAVLFALSYDGRWSCAPNDPDDDMMRVLVNRHQRRDKGFGPALGPGAASTAARMLESLGYTVRQVTSDWVLNTSSEQLQVRLITGWADAASDLQGVDTRAMAAAWKTRRLAHVAGGRSHLVVGHRDIAAWLP